MFVATSKSSQRKANTRFGCFQPAEFTEFWFEVKVASTLCISEGIEVNSFISLAQADNVQWDISLRFSDFIKFDGILRKIFSPVSQNHTPASKKSFDPCFHRTNYKDCPLCPRKPCFQGMTGALLVNPNNNRVAK
jgi:hypothetical protein